jgi:hypothetical protein
MAVHGGGSRTGATGIVAVHGGGSRTEATGIVAVHGGGPSPCVRGQPDRAGVAVPTRRDSGQGTNRSYVDHGVAMRYRRKTIS